MGLRKVLVDIYGNIPEELLEKDNDQFVSKNDIECVMSKYIQVRGSKCLICDKYNPHHQDFPGWIGSLKYDENDKIENKNIIIFGREVSNENSIKHVLENKYNFHEKFNTNFSYIHIWYELGYDQKANDLIKNKEYDNYLFESLDIIFSPLSKYIDRIYGTDLGKCYTNNIDKTRKICTNEYLPRELEYFKDENLTFILQGKITKQILKNYFRFLPNQDFIKYLDENEEKLKECGINCNNLEKDYNFEIGIFYPRGKKEINKSGKYFLIPHSSKRIRNTVWLKMHKNKGNKNLEEFLGKIRNYLSLI